MSCLGGNIHTETPTNLYGGGGSTPIHLNILFDTELMVLDSSNLIDKISEHFKAKLFLKVHGGLFFIIPFLHGSVGPGNLCIGLAEGGVGLLLD